MFKAIKNFFRNISGKLPSFRSFEVKREVAPDLSAGAEPADLVQKIIDGNLPLQHIVLSSAGEVCCLAPVTGDAGECGRTFQQALKSFKVMKHAGSNGLAGVHNCYFEFGCPQCGVTIRASFDEMELLAQVKNADSAPCITCYSLSLN